MHAMLKWYVSHPIYITPTVYNVSHPPLLISASNLRLIKLGTP